MPPSSVASLSAPIKAEKPDQAIPSCRSYCVTWLFGVVLLIFVIGAFNALVDPYLVIGTPRLAGLNAAKPEAATHTQLAKDYLIGRIKPAGLLLGTSKVDLGIDPESPFWPDNARPVFNYGVPGTSIRGNLADLRRAVTLGTVRRVLVVLEFGDFMQPPAKKPVSLPTTTTLKRMHDIVLATLSLDALRASIGTVIAQHHAAPIDLSQDGATNDQGFRNIVRADGYQTLFLQKDTENAERLARLAASLRAWPDAPLANLDAVEEIIALCQMHGIALDFALPPVHADLLVQMDRAGLWSRYQDVKTGLTRLVAAKGGNAVRLWDFSGFDTVSTEPVPSLAERRVDMFGFWEPVHFKRAVGEKMLAAIYGGVSEYGAPLTPGMIEPHLARETAARDAWLAGDTGKWRERLGYAIR
jgi:hypothetical protein